jgi:hypothetical protein
MNEDDYKNDLTQIILKYYHFSVPGVVWGQIRQYHDKLGMTYEGMFKTFLYVLEVKGLTFENKYGIGFVKVFYQEGYNYTKRSANNKPYTKTSRRQIVIKKQNHKPVLKKIDLGDLD